MLQKAIVRSAFSRTHTKSRRTCGTTLAFHQFIRPARSLGDRNLSQSSRRSHRTPAARNARIVNTGSQTLARNSRYCQSAKSGLNKSWLDAAFGQFFETLEYIAEKAGPVVIGQKPAYTSMVLGYRNEIIFTDCGIREYWDEQHSLMVDRDTNAAINLKRLGLDIFPSIKSRGGNLSLVGTMDDSTTKEILYTLHRATKKPTSHAVLSLM